MKCAKKIISVALVLMLALSVLIIPTSAYTPEITADVVATKMEGTSASGLEYYKFSVYLDSTVALTHYQLNITWDNSVWQLLNSKTLKNQAAFTATTVPIQDDPENIMLESSTVYQEYGGGNWDFPGSPNGYVLMTPDTGSTPTFAKISNDNMGEELTAAGYTGLYATWAVNFTDSYMTLSGGDYNGLNSPMSGKQMVLSWYMGVKEGVEPGNYEVGFNAKQFARLTGTYDSEDTVESINASHLKSITKDQVTYNNAIVTIGEAGPAVTKSNAEVKMVLNAEKNAVDFSADKAFQFRVTSSISEEDWNTYFGGNGQNINAVGFVAYNGDGAFDMETAKSVAKGGSAAGYTAATTDYIQKVDGQPANFGARIDFTARENVKDVTYIAFVQYDTDQFAFYDTSFDADLNSNYDEIVSQYAGFIAG